MSVERRVTVKAYPNSLEPEIKIVTQNNTLPTRVLQSHACHVPTLLHAIFCGHQLQGFDACDFLFWRLLAWCPGLVWLVVLGVSIFG
jgi:hypothetical protein